MKVLNHEKEERIDVRRVVGEPVLNQSHINKKKINSNLHSNNTHLLLDA